MREQSHADSGAAGPGGGFKLVMHRWLWMTLLMWTLSAAAAPAGAEVAGDAAVAAVRQAFEQIRADYVDPVDDARVLRAAIAAVPDNPKSDRRRIEDAALRQLAAPAPGEATKPPRDP
jgi:hypothetical protein